MFRPIVGERARADAFVARDAKIVKSHRAIARNADSALALFIQTPRKRVRSIFDGSIPRPCLRLLIWSADDEVNRRRTLPLPFTQELTKIRRHQRAQRSRIDRAVDIQPKVVRRGQKVRRKLTRALLKANIAQHGAVAVPGKIGCQFAEGNAFVFEVRKRDPADDIPPRP